MRDGRTTTSEDSATQLEALSLAIFEGIFIIRRGRGDPETLFLISREGGPNLLDSGLLASSFAPLGNPKTSENSKVFRKYRSQEARNTVRSFGQIQLTMFEKYIKRRCDLEFSVGGRSAEEVCKNCIY